MHDTYSRPDDPENQPAATPGAIYNQTAATPGAATASPRHPQQINAVSEATGEATAKAAGEATDEAAEQRAAMAWTRLAEGEDYAAMALVQEMGFALALDFVRNPHSTRALPEPIRKGLQRWTPRLDDAAFAQDLNNARVNGLGFVRWNGPGYPRQLLDAAFTSLQAVPPLGLWYSGDISLLHQPSLALVGSRAASAYGTRLATEFGFEAARHGIPVVSGGALGIDAAAHRGVLQGGGKAIVVFASGADRIYPRANAELFAEIRRTGGLIISESPPGAAPHRHRFLSRNRIIAGVSAGVVVVEAPYRSGAISTARHALTQGRPVGAVPNAVDVPHALGCLRLLREGAICIRSAADALELLGNDAVSPGSHSQLALDLGRGLEKSDPLAGDPLAVRIRDALPAVRAASTERIAATAGLGIAETMRGLGRLELAGIAERKAAGWRLTQTAREASAGNSN
ncbi:DNA-processing protein DprA [Actinobaculum suis]|uniref:DNA-processing protein DprA n=1 Tax=Actinobaculum suis TaxID=1657 RepID=UPI00066FFA35|nr:DNA-processing protein DprA [Actinobaculum suis]